MHNVVTDHNAAVEVASQPFQSAGDIDDVAQHGKLEPAFGTDVA